jgi:hypothetical protein
VNKANGPDVPTPTPHRRQAAMMATAHRRPHHTPATARKQAGIGRKQGGPACKEAGREHLTWRHHGA